MDVKYSTGKWIEIQEPIISKNRNEKNLISFFLDTKIEDNSRGFKLQKANFDSEVNTAVSLKFLQRGILLFIPFL